METEQAYSDTASNTLSVFGHVKHKYFLKQWLCLFWRALTEFSSIHLSSKFWIPINTCMYNLLWQGGLMMWQGSSSSSWLSAWSVSSRSGLHGRRCRATLTELFVLFSEACKGGVQTARLESRSNSCSVGKLWLGSKSQGFEWALVSSVYCLSSMCLPLTLTIAALVLLFETTQPPLNTDVNVQVVLYRVQYTRKFRAVLKSRCASICCAVGLTYCCMQNPVWTSIVSPAVVTLHSNSYLLCSCMLISVIICQCYTCPILYSD